MPVRRTNRSILRGLVPLAIAAAAVYFAPYAFGLFTLSLLTNAVIASIAILGLNVLFGYTGQISIGHAAFLGIGAYASAVLVDRSGWSYAFAVPVAMVGAFAVGLLVAVPALRLKGLYLALLTLALGAVFPGVVRGLDGLTTGDKGMFGVGWRAPEWTGLYGPDGQVIWMFWVSGACLVMACLVISNVLRSPIGRSLVAVRDHELAAASVGISVTRTKAMAFAVAGCLGALAGGLTAASVGVLTPAQFGLLQSIELLVAVVVGGLASVRGSVIGGAFYVFVPYYASDLFSGAVAGLVFAVAILLTLFLAPRGINGLVDSALARVKRAVGLGRGALGSSSQQTASGGSNHRRETS